MNDIYYKIKKKHGDFRVGIHCGNLCDALLVTPIFKRIKNGVIDIYYEDVPRRKSELFYGMAKINVTHNLSPACPLSNEDIHLSQRMLNALGIKNTNFLPWIILEDYEIEWAKKFLSVYENPLAFIPYNGASFVESNYFAQMRTFSPEMIRFFIEKLSSEYTLIHFGVDSSYYTTSRFEFIEVPGIINIANLDLRQLAACYKVIGKMVACDTGHPYLMIAVGGKIIEIAPMKVPHIYPYWHYLYSDKSLWGKKKVRAIYFDMSEYEKSSDYFNFDF